MFTELTFILYIQQRYPFSECILNYSSQALTGIPDEGTVGVTRHFVHHYISLHVFFVSKLIQIKFIYCYYYFSFNCNSSVNNVTPEIN